MKRDEMKKLEEKLTYKPKLVWDEIEDGEKERAFSLAEEYKNFLDNAKTEREAVSYIKDKAKK